MRIKSYENRKKFSKSSVGFVNALMRLNRKLSISAENLQLEKRRISLRESVVRIQGKFFYIFQFIQSFKY